MSYDENGELATDTRYSVYKDYNGVSFPSKIEIKRPQEEYDITLTIVKLELNQPLPDDKFALEQPPNAEVVHLDQSKTGASPTTRGPGSR
jgi:outer membrane lipoprotein-sorting protein